MTSMKLSFGTIPFAKMHGAGNDFVVVAEAPPSAPEDARLVRALADRRRGIGADGVLFLERLDRTTDLFRMHFYNSDGGRVQLCLNGARCVAWRAQQLGWVSAGSFSFATEGQSIEAEIIGAEGELAMVRLRVAAPTVIAPRLRLPDSAPAATGVHVDTGDPHLVIEVGSAEVESEDFAERARPLRHWTDELPDGANIHFVHRDSQHEWRIRSFERGVEDETRACGSGCLSAVAALAPRESQDVALTTRHGDVLRITSGGEAAASWELVGPAECSFTALWSMANQIHA
jgi:diaminopimelate epimerase